MLQPPLLTVSFSTSVFEGAVIARRLHENDAFRDIAEYATRGHALALPLVREGYSKGKASEGGSEYGAALCAADAYRFLGTFATARANGDDYEGALYTALESSKVAMMPYLYLHEGRVDDSVRHCEQHLRSNSHGSGKGAVTRNVLNEISFALKFLSTHLNQNNRIPDGSALALTQIQTDISDAQKAGTGLESAAHGENRTAEFLFMTNVQDWLQVQAVKSLMIEERFVKNDGRHCPLDRKNQVMSTGGFYRDICIELHAQLTDDIQSGAYLAHFLTVAGKVGKDAPVDPAVVLHGYMENVLAGHIQTLESGESPYCGPADAPFYAAAYGAFMENVHQQFPLRPAAALQSVPKGPVLS